MQAGTNMKNYKEFWDEVESQKTNPNVKKSFAIVKDKMYPVIHTQTIHREKFPVSRLSNVPVPKSGRTGFAGSIIFSEIPEDFDNEFILCVNYDNKYYLLPSEVICPEESLLPYTVLTFVSRTEGIIN